MYQGWTRFLLLSELVLSRSWKTVVDGLLVVDVLLVDHLLSSCQEMRLLCLKRILERTLIR